MVALTATQEIHLPSYLSPWCGDRGVFTEKPMHKVHVCLTFQIFSRQNGDEYFLEFHIHPKGIQQYNDIYLAA